MATIPELEAALINAHKAGATDHARILADELVRQRQLSGQEQKVPVGEFDIAVDTAPKEAPGLGTMAKEAAIMTGAGTVGQILGAPLGPVGVAVGGGLIGGLGGGLIKQLTRLAEDPNYKWKWGELGSDILTSSVPGGPLAKGGVKAVTKEGVKQGAAGLAGTTMESMIDRGELPTGTQALLGTALPAVGGAAAQRIGATNKNTLLAAAEAEGRRSVKSKTALAGEKLGLKLIPSDVDPSTSTKRLESLAGKAALRQETQLANAEALNKAVKADLGIPADTEVTIPVLRKIREEAGEAYNEIGKISEAAKTRLKQVEGLRAEMTKISDPAERAVKEAEFDKAFASTVSKAQQQAAADVEELKRLRAGAQLARDRWSASGGKLPDELDKSLSLREQAKALELKIEQTMTDLGRKDLADNLKAARERIAKTYNAEEALNLGTGDFDPKVFGRQLNRGVPLGGKLEDVAKFQQAFQKGMADPATVGAPGVGNVGFTGRMLLGGLTLKETKNPLLAAVTAFAPEVAGDMARKRLLSSGFQREAISALDPALKATAPASSIATRQAGQAIGSETTTPRPVTQQDILALRADPSLAKEFDAKFGTGEAKKYLRRK